MMTQSTPDTSVLVSLSELAEIEEERIRDEEKQHARARAERAREQRLAEQQRREEAAARAHAAEQARLQRERERTEEQARAEARRQAAIEVARIEAEGKARLAAEDAARAHELASIRARGERRSRRLQHGLVAVLGLALCGGAAAVHDLWGQVTELELQAQRLGASERTVTQAYDQLAKAELDALERRRDLLGSRSQQSEPEQVRVAAQAVQESRDQGTLEGPKLSALRTALDRWEAQLDTSDRLARLDARQADLAAWASTQPRSKKTEVARQAAARARQAGAHRGDPQVYETALDDLRQALSATGSSRGPRRPVATEPTTAGRVCVNPHDPMCGLDGKPLQ
jgi:colicin import membrane protein